MSDDATGMSPEKFVDIFYKKEIESNILLYKNLYFSSKDAESKDPSSDRILKFASKLSDADKEAALLLCRQVMIDTTCSLFAIIDGVADFDSPEDDFKLIYREDEVLSGDLLDLFLALDEERRP